MRPWLTIFFTLAMLTAGCAARSDRIDESTQDVIFLVPGAGGPSRDYQRVIDGLHDAGVSRPVQVVSWFVSGLAMC